MFPVIADAADERVHPPGAEPLWNESWYFDFATPDGSIGGYVRVGLYPNLNTVWYWACLVGADRPLVTVIDHEVPLPRSDSLEVRTSGLWADHHCEDPLVHWSLSLESFALELDDPADTYRTMVGTRVPFGFELEWETVGEVFRYPPGLDRYEVPCRVHGEVQVGPETIEVDAVGQRDHSWGVRDWWAQGWCWTAFQLRDHSAWHAVVPTGSPFSIGYRQAPGTEPEAVAEASVEPEPGREGLPRGGRLAIGPTAFTFAPVAWAPVLLVSPDGRQSRFPRALVHVESVDGQVPGVGWIEFNQPQPI